MRIIRQAQLRRTVGADIELIASLRRHARELLHHHPVGLDAVEADRVVMEVLASNPRPCPEETLLAAVEACARARIARARQ